MGAIEDVNVKEVDQMMKLNFYSAFNLVKHFLPGLKEANHGQFLFIGARPAVENEAGKDVVAYALSKKLVMTLADYVAEECKDTNVRSHIFVPSIIDTPQNREAMPDADFSTWVSPGEIAEAMHYAVNNSALRNMTFKLYGRA
ncbi:short-chain dehydrogenase/reductase SDR [Nitritalea halalkaliphila LW7]|uniref:Short-chain dehydrogenase/reductase SDR n=1 Tax=Nitritalea halalkaliphila LW7 TaxID=1189621 RepID=I5C5M6_9BACT|nr:short-chain dehydrogenase/reductase SDR [Nitritalea halalkaliphila LW7]